MKQSPISVKIVKFVFLVIGIYFVLASQFLNDLSMDLFIGKFIIGMSFIVLALLKRLRHPEYN